MKKATHNGTCQSCGRVQASTPRGLAKHGYTVNWGFFSGTCQGSHHAPIEEAHDLLDSIVAQLTATADRLNAITVETLDRIDVRWHTKRDQQGKRTQVERHFETEAAWDEFRKSDEGLSTTYGWKTGHYATSNDYYSFAKMAERNVEAAHRQAKQMLSHCEALEGLKASRHGKPLYERVDPKAAPDRCPGSGQSPAPRKEGSKGYSLYRRCATCGVGFKITQHGLVAAHKIPKVKNS